MLDASSSTSSDRKPSELTSMMRALSGERSITLVTDGF
jgi:hypothetical protein